MLVSFLVGFLCKELLCWNQSGRMETDDFLATLILVEIGKVNQSLSRTRVDMIIARILLIAIEKRL